MTHLISSHRTSTGCAVIGRSHGKLDRALHSCVVKRPSSPWLREQLQCTRFRWN